MITRHLYQDNMSAMAVIQAELFNIKNCDVKYKYLQQLVLNKDLAVHYKPTADMIADILTKPQDTKAFQRHTTS